MKSILKLALILTAFSQVSFASDKTILKTVQGTWTLRERTCTLDGSFLDSIKARITQSNRLATAGEILIISPDKAIRMFDSSGQLISEGDYILNKKEILVRTTAGKPFSRSTQINYSYGNRLITNHKSNAECKDGIVNSVYLKIIKHSQISYNYNDDSL